MRRIFTALIAAGAMLAAAPLVAQAASIDAPAGTYKLDKAHASLTWRVDHLGLSMYTARFTDFDASILLDPKAPTRSTVSVTINPKSVRTDFPFPEKENFDKEIAEEILKANAHPTISFRSTSLVATGSSGRSGRMTGDLTFMGVTRPVTLDVTLNGAKPNPFSKVPTLGFSASGSINRSEFGSTSQAPAIGDKVQLLIEAEFQKQ